MFIIYTDIALDYTTTKLYYATFDYCVYNYSCMFSFWVKCHLDYKTHLNNYLRYFHPTPPIPKWTFRINNIIFIYTPKNI